MKNSVAILNSYTYNSLSKKVSRRVVKKVKISENMEEEITEQQVQWKTHPPTPWHTWWKVKHFLQKL